MTVSSPSSATSGVTTPGAHHGRGAFDKTPPSSRASSDGGASELGTGLDALSSALGIDTDELLQRLTDGTGISDLLSANPEVSTQLSQLQNKGALVDGYA